MIVFFLNRFNDVDHTVPVVYRIARDSDEEVLLLSLNPNLDIYSDFRLRFLREKFNIRIEYLYNFCCFSIAQKIIGFLLCHRGRLRTSKKRFFKTFGELCKGKIRYSLLQEMISNAFFLFFNRYIYDRIMKNMLKNIFDKEWAKEMYRTNKYSVLVFDWAAHLKLFNVAALLSASKELNIPTVDIPHGVPLYNRNPSYYDKAFDQYRQNDKDYFIVPNRWFRDDCIRKGLNPDKVSILGSARFCNEWKEILHSIIPPDNALMQKGAGKLKVVYMEYGLPLHFIDTVKDSIYSLSELEFIHLIIKPQTRSNKLHFEMPSNVEIAFDENSVNLIKWADVVIVIQTSIILEIYLQDKVFIYPKFFHGDKMTFEEYNACWTVNSYDEMKKALAILNENKAYKPYTDTDVKKYLTDVVYNGVWDRDILGDYKDFILGISQNRNLS